MKNVDVDKFDKRKVYAKSKNLSENYWNLSNNIHLSFMKKFSLFDKIN